ncbi:MAG TPA: G1 family glutamic endopeptidase, partial [Gemmatirosa sp.]
MRKVRDGTSILGYGYQPPARTPQAEPGRATDAAAYGLHADHSVRLLATNLPGVFTKVRGENQTADPLSIAPLIHSTLLARLQTSETPAARSFRERVLARRWRPEDQIVPVLASRLGVTHQLTARVELADTAFISNNWAGSTIPGTWDNATGIWRVPTVDRPSTPQGSSGGWNSSSWVGIDGTYGSNDVLQAGVQQAVSGGGDASYVPWFEWFVPNQSGPPSYIFQTNIADMRIDPGDEVFCLVQYVGRQGEVLFGNVDRGHYVSLVLAPPPGASFSGNSAEWIVEAPNAGEPTTSLPRFTPVVFSTAVATNPLGTDGNPANGDTTNISRFGAPLTSVSLRQHALEIDYQAPGWLHNLPSAAVGAVPAALGTSPTSWYTTPEDVQHIAYVGTDAQIH